MNVDAIECLGIKRVLDRGTAEVLFRDEGTMLIQDTVSSAVMLASDDAEAGKKALTENYDLISPEELREVIERKALLIGEKDGDKVGFIGEHLEGSMGLLYVFPEHRRNHYAQELESIYVSKTLDKGVIPFGQVKAGHEPSLRLQEKLGFTKSETLIYWMWKE